MPEFAKFLKVTQYIAKQYWGAIHGAAEARHFFTRVYKDTLTKTDSRKLPYYDDTAAESSPARPVTVYADPKEILSNASRRETSATSPLERQILSAIVGSREPKQVFEFGTAKGGSTYHFFLNSSPHCEITTFDYQPPRLTDARIKMAFTSSRIQVLCGDSFTYDFSSLYNRFDLIFIDGGHDYDCVKKDTENALKMIRRGGVILWHDYCPHWPQVVSYLNELSDSLPLKWFRGTTLVIGEVA